MGPTGEQFRVVQVHPTRLCNLRCQHCYSLSGPEERGQLPLAFLRTALIDAAVEGYNVMGVSGGEPLLYESLRPLLIHARAVGMSTTVTSNGMLLDDRRIGEIGGLVDVLAISLDGVPASHNRMRCSERAFDTMAARLEGVRRAGLPFGFIFTLTLHNVHELDWVAQFAVEQGAKLLQIHPLEITGRAVAQLAESSPDETESAYAYLEVDRIQKRYGDRLQFQLDLLDRTLLCGNAGRLLADAPPENLDEVPLSDLVSPLIIESDGAMVPVRHGFSRHYALGNLHSTSLCRAARDWRRSRSAPFRALCRRVYDELLRPTELPFANWYEVIARAAAAEEREATPHLPLTVRPALAS